MAGKRRPQHRREKMIGEREVARVLPIVGNVGLEILIVRVIVGPAVHGAVVPVGERAVVAVADVVGEHRGRLAHVGSVGLLLRALGAGEAAEVVVEGVVLLHDDDDMIERNLALHVDARRRARRRRSLATERSAPSPQIFFAGHRLRARVVASGAEERQHQVFHPEASDDAEGRVNRAGASTLPCSLRCWPVSASGAMLRASSLMSASGARPLDAWYAIFIEPLQGAGRHDRRRDRGDAFVDPELGLQPRERRQQQTPSASPSRRWPPTPLRITVLVARRAGSSVPTTGASGEVTLTSHRRALSGRRQPTGPLVGAGGHVAGNAYFDLGGGLLLDGNFSAPHCATLDFRNAP